MALRPPKDFRPPAAPPRPPSEGELRALWARREASRRDRDRASEWKYALEGARRDGEGELHAAEPAAPLPTYLRDRLRVGPHARAALRPLPREGRVLATGIDTFSPCWYAEAGSPLARAMRGLATEPSRRAMLVPEPLGGYRVGWFPEPGLVFAEGHPLEQGLVSAARLPEAEERLGRDLADLGIPVAAAPSAGLRRIDVAADLWIDSAVEGLAFLECVAAASPGSGKLAAYRAERCVESVLIKSTAGRTLARLYDKGVRDRSAPRGRWIRLEAQWRFQRQDRPRSEELGPTALRERFKRRFEPLWQAAGGHRVGGLAALTERLSAALASGQLQPSRARSVAGYLLLRSAGLPQGANRTAYELERECRQLGLSVSLLATPERRIDVATVLDECLAPELWE